MSARRPSQRRRWFDVFEGKSPVSGDLPPKTVVVPRTWFAEWAWLGGDDVAGDVLISVVGDRIVAVQPGMRATPPDAIRLDGLTLPGLANAHSHAFHRALRGRTHGGPGDFWTWRRQMYALAADLDPDSYYRIARDCYTEMARAGITVVGEFHYLHHDVGGAPYADPNAMAEVLRQAAADAGIRVTLLDTLYLHGGFRDEPLDPVQRRFADGDPEAWAKRVELLAASWAEDPTARVGVAVHSVRAVDPLSARRAAELLATGTPLHVHVSEQPAENDACRREHQVTPTRLLADAGVLGPATTAVHATHVTDDDLDLLERSGATVCLCPTTERDLADGVGPARELRSRGVPVALGTDSHAVVDLFEEARLVELHERLVSGRRGGVRAAALLTAATTTGARSLGWTDGGLLAPGHLADFVTVDTGSVRLAGVPPDDLVAAVVFSATAADVTDVVVGGRPVVSNRTHVAATAGGGGEP